MYILVATCDPSASAAAVALDHTLSHQFWKTCTEAGSRKSVLH